MQWYSDFNLRDFESYLASLENIRTASEMSIESDPNFSKIRNKIKYLLMTGVSVIAILSLLGGYFQSQDQQEQWKQEVVEIQQEIKSQPAVEQIDSQDIDNEELFRQISMGEGYREYSYNDNSKEKNRTIGLGFNMDRPGARADAKRLLGITDADWAALYGDKKKQGGTAKLSKDQIIILFQHDVENAKLDCKRFLPNFDQQPRIVKQILIDMMFNMGPETMSDFDDLRAALLGTNNDGNPDYHEAAKEMEDSDWFRDTKNRARRLINLMSTYANMLDFKGGVKAADAQIKKMMDKYFGK